MTSWNTSGPDPGFEELLISTIQADGWVERISRPPGDPKRAQGMGSAGRRFVRDNLDSRVAAERLIGILEGIRQR